MTETSAFVRSSKLFSGYVAEVKDGQGKLPTPDTEWSVHDLVNHVTNENKWVVDLLAGRTIAEVGTRYDGDLLGNDPAVAAMQAASEAEAAVEAHTDLASIVHLSFGDVPAAEYLRQMVIDHVIHAWDLARAIGADETIDPDLAATALEWFTPQAEGWRQAGIMAAAVIVPDDADAQTKLLALSGRNS